MDNNKKKISPIIETQNKRKERDNRINGQEESETNAFGTISPAGGWDNWKETEEKEEDNEAETIVISSLFLFSNDDNKSGRSAP